MRLTKYALWVSAAVMFVTSLTPAWGILNNGFETDYVYLIRGYGTPYTTSIRRHLESDMTEVGGGTARWQEGAGWKTLTFSGSQVDPARLFVAKENGTDITVGELDSNGALIKSTDLSTLIGGSPNLSSIGDIRYNRYHNSLILGARTATGNLGKAWEIDLGLSSLLHTYVGPGIPDVRPANIAFNERTGALYMISRNLNEASSTTKGDLVAFSTVNRDIGGQTSTWSLLVDGTTKQAGDSAWKNPGTVVYRDRGGDDTALTYQGGVTSAVPVMESWLDTTLHSVDGNGNLALRGKPGSTANTANGQQDELTGYIWTASFRGGLDVLRPDDTTQNFKPSADNGWEYWDIDSPPYFGPVPPIISPTPNDTALVDIPYERQLTLSQGTPPVTWSLITGPTDATVDSSTGLVSGWTPTENDAGGTVTFTIQATNDNGSTTTHWQTDVYNSINGFLPAYVYVSRSSGDNRNGFIRLHRKSDGVEVARWDPGADPKYKYWTTLTFSGTGRNNDARLFVAQPLNIADDWYGDDILIAELDASGNTINSKPLSQLMGGQSPGPYLDLGPIRYNRFHNTLIVSADPDGNNTSAIATAWEVDLGLTTLIHTYKGDVVGAGRYVATAFDERTGKLYMGARNLGNHTDQGDLIVFDTANRLVGDVTTTYSLAIDGPARYLNDAYWYDPVAPIYRAGNPTRYDGSDTLVDLTGARAAGGRAYEVYLDTVLHPPAADGLISTGLDKSVVFRTYLGYNGQQEEPNGDIWVANFREGFSVLRSDNTFADFQSGSDWWDIDTPPYQTCNAPAFDLDGDTDVDQADFAVFQAECFGQVAPFEGTLSQTCACVDLGDGNDDGVPDRNGTIDGFDYAAFEDCASGPGIPAVPTCGG